MVMTSVKQQKQPHGMHNVQRSCRPRMALNCNMGDYYVNYTQLSITELNTSGSGKLVTKDKNLKNDNREQ